MTTVEPLRAMDCDAWSGDVRLWVELRGFEPLTFSLRTRRATNCATAPSAEEKLPPRPVYYESDPGCVTTPRQARRTTAVRDQAPAALRASSSVCATGSS